MSTLLVLLSLVLAIGLLWLVVYLDTRRYAQMHLETERKRVEYGRSKFASLQERKRFVSGIGEYQMSNFAVPQLPNASDKRGFSGQHLTGDEISRLTGRAVQ